MVKKVVINRKIQTISDALEFLAQHEHITFEEFKNNLVLQYALIFQLEKAIQALIDLAFHVVSDEGWGVVLHKANVADTLVKHNVISSDYRDVFIKIYGFRNRLVHEYEEMNLETTYEIIIGKKKDIAQLLHQIMDYLGI
ncbi:type VII toxin-antitoxin system HepT family RNase toxin [Calditrichota bacterium GD2]